MHLVNISSLSFVPVLTNYLSRKAEGMALRRLSNLSTLGRGGATSILYTPTGQISRCNNLIQPMLNYI